MVSFTQRNFIYKIYETLYYNSYYSDEIFRKYSYSKILLFNGEIGMWIYQLFKSFQNFKTIKISCNILSLTVNLHY